MTIEDNKNLLIGIIVVLGILCLCSLICSSLLAITGNTTNEPPPAPLPSDYNYGSDDFDINNLPGLNNNEEISLDLNKPLDESAPPSRPSKSESENNDSETKLKKIKISDAKLTNSDNKTYLVILDKKAKYEVQKGSIKKTKNGTIMTLTSGDQVILIK